MTEIKLINTGNTHRFSIKNADEEIGTAVVSLVGDVLKLNSIYISPLARRQGIARTLLIEAIQYARLNGAKRLEGDFVPEGKTSADKKAAKRFYEEFGIKILKGDKLFANLAAIDF